MTTHVFKVVGMHCASCAAIITKKVSVIPGIQSVSVNYGSEKALIDFDSNIVPFDSVNDEIKKLGYSIVDEEMGSGKVTSINTKELELEKLEQKIQFIVPVTFTIFVLMMWDILARTTVVIPNLPLPMTFFNTFSMVIATVTLFWVGRPYLE